MDMKEQLGDWYPILAPVLDTPEMDLLGRRLATVRDKVQPSLENVFRAFRLCSPQDVKVLILGQDPYPHGADGLSFSNNQMKPSLRIIFQELKRCGFERTKTTLDDWAKQGVLLLNACLTTDTGNTLSHGSWGWDFFLKEVMRQINALDQPIVIIGWGKWAQDVLSRSLVHRTNRLFLFSPHPQAQNYNASIRFVGNDHFDLCNAYLVAEGLTPIKWGNPE